MPVISYRGALVVVILFELFLPARFLGQSGGWVNQSSGTTKWLLGSDFVSAYEGWAVGDGGTILHTSNTGISWQAQPSGTSLSLQSIDFINLTTGWIVGGEGGRGIILKSTNGGVSWVVQDTTTVLLSVKFTSPSTGWGCGIRWYSPQNHERWYLVECADVAGSWRIFRCNRVPE